MGDRQQWQFPRNEASKILGWTSDGKRLENKDPLDIANLFGLFDTRSDVTTAFMLPSADWITTAGYSSVGDGGGALYKRVGAEPAHAGKVQSLDGTWWELAAEKILVEMFGALGDSNGTPLNGTDNTTFINNAIHFADIKGIGEVYCIGGIYRITSSLLMPGLSEYNNNNIREAGFSLIGGGPTYSKLFYDADSGYAVDAEDFASNGPRTMQRVEGWEIFAKPFSTAEGAIRLKNSRLPTIERNFIHSFPNGDAITIYAQGTGGAWYHRISGNQIGWWHENLGADPVIGVDDVWWMKRGIVMIGSEDASGKANEGLLQENAIWNCKEAYIAVTGFDTDGNPGIPDQTQNGLLGGGGYNRLSCNTLYGGQSARVNTGTVQSATSTTVVLESGASATNDEYNGLQIWIGFGTGAGQVATITDYDGATKTVTISGAWDTNPDGTSSYQVGHRAVGVLYDSAGGISAFSTYTENVPVPVRITHNADRHFEWFADNIKNTGTGIYFDVYSEIEGTAQAGSLSTVTLAASSSSLDDFYVGRAIFISGKGTRTITSYNGSTKVATVAADFDSAAAASDPYTILGSPFPKTILNGNSTRYPAQRPAAMQLNADAVMVGETSIFTDPSGFYSVWANVTGGNLSPGDVVRQGTQGPKNAASTSTAGNEDRPKVVAGRGGASTIYPDGGQVLIARSGAEVSVKVTGTINEGDTLVTSSVTAGMAMVNNAQTDPKKIIGYATTSGTSSVMVEIL